MARTTTKQTDQLNRQNKTVGGVWSEQNIYPGLKTNNIRGGIDFSDFPMHDGFGVPAGQHVSGEVMHKYIKAYAAHFKLMELVDLESPVTEISKTQGTEGWNVKLSSGATLQTVKLIVATGVTNAPHHPQLSGTAEFGGPIVHSGELGTRGSAIMENAQVQTVAVIGGGKSAYDAVHLAGKAGKRVEWIIRKSGKGPEWIFPAHTMGPLKAVREKLPARRFVSFFSPNLWDDGFGWVKHFLHFTKIGKAITEKFWLNLHQATVDDCGMRNDEKTKVLEPEQRYAVLLFGSVVFETNPRQPLLVRHRLWNLQLRRERCLRNAQDWSSIRPPGRYSQPSFTYNPLQVRPLRSSRRHHHRNWIHSQTDPEIPS